MTLNYLIVLLKAEECLNSKTQSIYNVFDLRRVYV